MIWTFVDASDSASDNEDEEEKVEKISKKPEKEKKTEGTTEPVMHVVKMRGLPAQIKEVCRV